MRTMRSQHPTYRVVLDVLMGMRRVRRGVKCDVEVVLCKTRAVWDSQLVRLTTWCPDICCILTATRCWGWRDRFLGSRCRGTGST